MTEQAAGPGELSSENVGQYTIAKTFEVTPRRIMAYAAGIADSNPAYFDDLSEGGLVGHPFMAYTFEWNSRFMPQVRANPRAGPYGVHAGTDLQFTRPFREGDVITAQGRNISSRQINPGVLSWTRYLMTDASGELVAQLDTSGITRGATLAGEDIILEESMPVPQAIESSGTLWTSSVYIPREAGQTYTECADIYNPIHTERRVAVAAGLPDIILHGSATQAIAMSQIIEKSLGGDPGRVRRFVGQLRAMVLMDTTIEIRCLAEQTNNEGELEIFFEVLNAEGRPAVANGVVVATAGG
jgi:acyl dehydratase|tara:strand:+ start:3205 stop:4101 length:897 start_codon:yes stop_codon:yes gene_type:complete